MDQNNTYPHESQTMTLLPGVTPQSEELRSVVEETLFRMHADHSQPQPTEVYLSAMVASWMAHLVKAEIPWHEVPQLYDNAIQSRASDDSRRGYMPVVEDLLHEWQVFSEQAHQVARADDWRKRDAEILKGLPEGRTGQGRHSFVGHMALGRAVVCLCPAVRGYDVPAKLMPEPEMVGHGESRRWVVPGGSDTPRFWACAAGKCNFYLPAERTAEALPPVNAGPNTGTRLDVDTEPIKSTPNHSAFLIAFAADANVDLEALTAQQYLDFRLFGQWYRDTFPGCKISRSLLEEYYPKFLEETAKPKHYV